MKPKHVLSKLTIFSALALPGLLSYAATTTELITQPGPGPLSVSGGNNTLGISFTVRQFSLQVTALGFWDESVNGLFNSHSVGIWSSTGTLLTSVLVPAGSSATLINEYRYVNLPAPLTLLPGGSYVIGASYLNNDSDKLLSPQPPDVGAFNPAVIAGDRRTSQNLGFSYPTMTFAAGSYSGPNALIAVAPEPTCFAILSITLLTRAIQRKRPSSDSSSSQRPMS